MKNNIKFKLYGLLLFLFAFASCETADQDVSPIISPNSKPMVTITAPSTSIPEGSTAIISIDFDSAIDRAVTFTPTIGGTADDHDYEALEPVTMAPYTKSVEFPIVILPDYIIENNETITVEFEIEGIAEKYLVHPETVLEPVEITVSEVTDATLLTINFAWDNDLDMDMLTYSDTPTYPAELWGTGGATGANPEIDHSIWLADPVGDYYVCILDWWEGVDFNYTYTLAYPDGTVETIEGTFDATNYPYDYFEGPSSWGSPNAYKILKVVNDGTKFVVTAL